MDEEGDGKDKPAGVTFRRYEPSWPSSGSSLGSGQGCVTVKRSLVARLTKYIVQTYQKCNPGFKYSDALNLKRFLTDPSNGVLNDGHDNADSHLILYVNLVLCSGLKRRYIVKDILGQGTFAQVAKCWDMETNNYVAIKIIKNLPQYYQHGQFEVHLLSMLNQKSDPDDEHHIVRMLDNFIFQNHLCISFEMLGPNLYELITMNKYKGLTLSIIAVFCRQILDALTIMKNAGIIHCDLKPENILISSEKPPKVKVIDIGSACFMSKTIYTYIQSRYYRSPEVLLGYPYTIAIDMWSLGCIVAELFLGCPLFPGKSEFDVLKRMTKILGGQPPDDLLRNATKTNNFFKHVDSIYQLVGDQSSNRNSSAYQILTEEEFERRGLERPEIGKEYFDFEKLEDIIANYGYRKNLAEEQLAKESAMRLVLIDFLRGLLEFDPGKRWSPLQASHHPFVTGEPFLFPYRPPPETLLISGSNAFRVECNSRQGHRIAAGISPEVTNVNKYLPQNRSKIAMLPSFSGSSYGSSESRGSFNYSASLGSDYRSYSDANSMSTYYSPVHRSLLPNIARVGGSILGVSAEARDVPFCQRNGFGISPSCTFWPISLGASPSRFTPPNSKELRMFQGKYAPHSSTESIVHNGFSWGKASNDKQSKFHQASYGSVSIQPHETSLNYNCGLSDAMSCSYGDANYQGLAGSTSSTISASDHSNNRPGEVLWDKAELSSSPPDPRDWDPNYSDELLFQGDCSEISSLPSGFDSIIHLTSGVGTLPLNNQQAHMGSSNTYSNPRNRPVIQGLLSGYVNPVFLPRFLPQYAQNTPRHFGQQSFQQLIICIQLLLIVCGIIRGLRRNRWSSLPEDIILFSVQPMAPSLPGMSDLLVTKSPLGVHFWLFNYCHLPFCYDGLVKGSATDGILLCYLTLNKGLVVIERVVISFQLIYICTVPELGFVFNIGGLANVCQPLYTFLLFLIL